MEHKMIVKYLVIIYSLIFIITVMIPLILRAAKPLVTLKEDSLLVDKFDLDEGYPWLKTFFWSNIILNTMLVLLPKSNLNDVLMSMDLNKIYYLILFVCYQISYIVMMIYKGVVKAKRLSRGRIISDLDSKFLIALDQLVGNSLYRFVYGKKRVKITYRDLVWKWILILIFVFPIVKSIYLICKAVKISKYN